MIHRHSERYQKFHHIAFLVPFLLSACSSSHPQNLQIAMEYPAPNEVQVTQRLTDALAADMIEMYPNQKMLRAAHPKQHGCVKATFQIREDLPEFLKVGIFSQPRSYPAWIRYSTANGSVASDSTKGILGMAIKVIGVEGEKLLEDEANEKTQDFLLISHPVLPAKNAEDFLSLLETPIAFILNPFDSHLRELGIMLDARENHASPVSIPYWSTTPYKFGSDQAVKYSAKPCAPADQKLPDQLSPDYLRQAMKEQLEQGGACYDFMVQFQTDPNVMLVEDARSLWDESESPFMKVASVAIRQQSFESQEQMKFCENLSFTPWHSLPDHRPIGSINRARKQVYRAGSRFRHETNNAVRAEPTGLEDF